MSQATIVSSDLIPFFSYSEDFSRRVWIWYLLDGKEGGNFPANLPSIVRLQSYHSSIAPTPQTTQKEQLPLPLFELK